MPLAASLTGLLITLACLARMQAQQVSTPTVPAAQWAAQAAAEEVHDLEPYHTFLRYHSHTIDSKGNLLRDVIESRDGSVARLIAKEGRALTPAEDEAERQRLQAMVDDPAAYAKHVKGELASKKQAIEVIREIPNAMIFSYSEGQPQPSGLATRAVVLDFHPNPAWSPPTLASETLTGIEGRLWIDPQTHHMLRLQARVFRPVNVGFGVFAKLFPGGTVDLDQSQAAEHRWLPSHFVEHITLRALMVKTLKENADGENSDSQPVESMSYQSAIKLLLDTPLPR